MYNQIHKCVLKAWIWRPLVCIQRQRVCVGVKAIKRRRKMEVVSSEEQWESLFRERELNALLIRLALQLLFTTVAIVCNKRVPRISHFLNSYPCDRNNKWAKWENRILWKEQWIFTAIANNPTLSSTTYSGIHIYFPSIRLPLGAL